MDPAEAFKKLTLKQRAFVEHYTRHLNATEAYRHAYPTSLKWTAKRVHTEAQTMLNNPKVAAIVAARAEKVQRKAEQEFDISAKLILQELAAIALARPGDYYRWGKKKTTRYAKDGSSYEVEIDFVELTPSDQLSDTQKKAVASAEMTTNKFGDTFPALKLHDRVKALVKLGEHFQLFNGKLDVNVTHGGMVSHQPVAPDAVKKADDPKDAAKLFDLFRKQQQLPPAPGFGKAN